MPQIAIIMEIHAEKHGVMGENRGAHGAVLERVDDL